MKQTDAPKIPAIVEMFTFWFGSHKTNWKGIQQEWGLTDEQIQRLKSDNKAFRETKSIGEETCRKKEMKRDLLMN